MREKLEIIWHIIRGGQYAVYIIHKNYINMEETPNGGLCVISDNAPKEFLETIVTYTNSIIKENE